MDNLTHSLVGALIGQAGLKKETGLAMPALILGANLPDVDAACLLWLDGVQHLGFRRGITHGPIAWVVLPLVLAGLLYGFDRWQAKRGKRPEGRPPVQFGWLYALGFIACLTHPAMDWLNVYGIRLLEPFSSRWFYGDTLFIIDVWLWVGLGVATWLSLRREKRGGNWRRPARIGLSVALVYVIVNWHITALSNFILWDGPGSTLIANPPPALFWERPVIAGEQNNWFILGDKGGPITKHRCAWPDVEALKARSPQLRAFLFWSRAPFVERHANGTGIVFQDARYYNRSIRGGMLVEFPGVECRQPQEG